MARLARIDAPGSWHHVMHRGARRAPIFRDDDDCLLFLGCLQEAVESHGFEVHAYALMPNHYHLLVRSPLGNVSRCMKHVNATYTLRANRRRGWDGPIFRGRFRSQLVRDDRYLGWLFAYLHLNPFRAGLAARADDICWSSLRAYVGKERAPSWLTTDVFATRLGGPNGIAEYVRGLRKRPESWPQEMDLETGWIRVAGEPVPAKEPARRHSPPVGRKTIDQVLAEVSRVSGCTVADLKRPEMGPRANPGRRLAVWALSRAGDCSHREIGAALGMSEGQVAKTLWRLRAAKPGPVLSAWMSALSDGPGPKGSGSST